MSVVDKALNAYLATRSPLTPSELQTTASAFLAGYRAGLEHGGQIAEDALDTATRALAGIPRTLSVPARQRQVTHGACINPTHDEVDCIAAGKSADDMCGPCRFKLRAQARQG